MAVRENIRDDVVAALEAAAGRLEARGWTRGRMGGPPGPNCVAGAIEWVIFDAGLPDDMQDIDGIYWSARDALQRFVGASVITWNDNQCSGAVTAIETLRLTAKEVANGNL